MPKFIELNEYDAGKISVNVENIITVSVDREQTCISLVSLDMILTVNDGYDEVMDLINGVTRDQQTDFIQRTNNEIEAERLEMERERNAG
jgi:hypothetical protein